RGTPLLLKVKLVAGLVVQQEISGKTISFQYQDHNQLWHIIPDDDISITSLTTDSDGFGSVYFLIPDTFDVGGYNVKAIYTGGADYDATEQEFQITVVSVSWKDFTSQQRQQPLSWEGRIVRPHSTPG